MSTNECERDRRQSLGRHHTNGFTLVNVATGMLWDATRQPSSQVELSGELSVSASARSRPAEQTLRLNQVRTHITLVGRTGQGDVGVEVTTQFQ